MAVCKMVDTRAAFYLLNINKNFVPIFLLLFINVKNYHSNEGRDAEKNLVDQNLSWAGDRVMQAGNRNGEHNRDDRLHLRRDLRTSRARENCNEIVGVSSSRGGAMTDQREEALRRQFFEASRSRGLFLCYSFLNWPLPSAVPQQERNLRRCLLADWYKRI